MSNSLGLKIHKDNDEDSKAVFQHQEFSGTGAERSPCQEPGISAASREGVSRYQ